MRRRQGFTLVELLVAMALIIFIMAILSQAFVSAMGTFRKLKAVGDMAEKLRATTQLLQRDLAADHFNGKLRLSNPFFWANGPPQQGYFQIWQGSLPSAAPGSSCFIEGSDLSNIGSYRSVDHTLAFTIKLRGNQMGDFLSAAGAGGALLANLSFGSNEARYQPAGGATVYNFQWAEVAWFLKPSINPATGQQDTTAADQATGAPPVPLYTLYRRQRLAVPDNSLVNPPIAATQAADCLELSCWPIPSPSKNLYFNNPTDLTVPQRRFGGGVPTAFTTLAQDLTNLKVVNSGLAGADIQLTDVMSFDVRVLTPDSTFNFPDPFVTLFDSPLGGYWNGNPNFNPSNGPMSFDTWSSVLDGLSNGPINFSQWSAFGQSTSLPMLSPDTQEGPIIQALQISIRIWDPKTSQTRQVTIVQAM